MSVDMTFAERIRARYPEGLTGIIAVGGTRTMFILEHNRDEANPGKIIDFREYGMEMLERYFTLIESFFELGGQNLVIPILSYQRFYEHGVEYAEMMSNLSLHLISERTQQFYRATNVDPYFVGIDTLLKLPDDHPAHRLSVALSAFQNGWDYQEGRHKVLWEIAPIALYSFWNAANTVDPAVQAELATALANTGNLDEVYRLTYKYYARAAYGTELPPPHFYLGSNRNGDLKLQTVMPAALFCGVGFRMFFTPYPTLFMTRDTLQAILEDLAFGKTLSSKTADYSEQFTSELAQAEYERVLNVSANAQSALGLKRSVGTDR